MDLESLCCGCLSSDRRLYEIKDLVILEAELQFVQLNKGKYVCWECKAILFKMYTFRNKVARAELLLNNYWVVYKNMSSTHHNSMHDLLKTLSNLVKESIVNCDQDITEELNNTDNDSENPSVTIKSEIIIKENIKKETCDSVPIEYDCNEIAEDMDGKESDSQSEDTEDIFNDADLNIDINDSKHNYNDKIIYNSIPVYFNSDNGTEQLLDNKNDSKEVTDIDDNVNNNYFTKRLTYDEVMAKRRAEMDKCFNVEYKCEKCWIHFKNEVKYLKHGKYHLEENKYSCSSCPVTFPSRVKLHKHTSTNHIQYQCKVCAFVCHTVTSITLHMDSLHCDGDFTVFEDVLRNLSVNKASKCDACHKVLESEWQLHAHRELTHAAAHASLDDYCVNCKIKFKTSSGYKTHIKMNKHCGSFPNSSQSDGNVKTKTEVGGSPSTEMNPYYKQKCLEEIYSIEMMCEDKLKKHREEMRDAPDFVKCKYVCGSCVEGFKTRKLLKVHLKLHEPDGQKWSARCRVCRVYCAASQMAVHVYEHYKLYRCYLCQFSSKDFLTIQDHYKKKHVYFTDDKVNEYTCKYCPSIPVFRNRNTYKYHMMTRHSEVNSCNICGKKFRAKHSLTTHIIQVHKGADYAPHPQSECTVCHKTYNTKYLKTHMRNIHTEIAVKPFCIECNKYFKNELCYKAHVTSHSSHVTTPLDKKYQCAVCLKRFQSSRLLKYHNNVVHLREQETPCHLCDKKFISIYGLRRHIDVVHKKIKKKKNKCAVCGEMVVQIKDHMNTHTGQRPYECGVCQDTFSHKSSLYMHNRLVHLKLKKNRKPKKTDLTNLD